MARKYKPPSRNEIDACNNCKLEMCNEQDARCGLRNLIQLTSRIKPSDDILKQDIISILTALKIDLSGRQSEPASVQAARIS